MAQVNSFLVWQRTVDGNIFSVTVMQSQTFRFTVTVMQFSVTVMQRQTCFMIHIRIYVLRYNDIYFPFSLLAIPLERLYKLTHT